MANHDRPLSPHLSVYRWQVSNGLSILHRMTGFALFTGAFLFVVWLLSALGGEACYTMFMDIMCSWFGILVTLGYTFCFYYHLCNGIRHLGWDIGKGFDKDVAVKTGIVVVITSTALTLASAFIVWNSLGGAS
ncbi:MAG: succinate dehydrogenase, cytochrome b556 subunit [Gammaproteobacteria bacterium]|nr:succinate dehydrogenase, cytochrome b556 subunit [Gammaproteobacteria bacterium]